MSFRKDVQALVDRYRLDDSVTDAVVAAATRGKKVHGAYSALSEINDLLEMHGVESITIGDERYDYCNAGDTYAPTVVYSVSDQEFFVSDYGSVVEQAEPSALEEAWDSWLARDVRTGIIKEWDELGEGPAERLGERLEALSDEALLEKFQRALPDDTGGINAEIVFESDGSIFVHKLSHVIERLAKSLRTSMPNRSRGSFRSRR